jgi:hypothetical protein
MGWRVIDLNAAVDRAVDRMLERFDMVEEDIASTAFADEDDEPERPRHRHRRLGESPEPDVF